jgi:hypothetical protein
MLPLINNTPNRKQLEAIKNYFGTGQIIIERAKGKNQSLLQYRTRSLKDCLIIKNHFNKYPLITNKEYNFNL